MDKHAGSPFERAVIDGRPYVVKHIGYDLDRLARALGGRDCFALTMWRTGLLHALPSAVDQATIGVAYDAATGHVSMLMHDIGRWIVPAGSDAVPLAMHRARPHAVTDEPSPTAA
jgi:hypothetical protein